MRKHRLMLDYDNRSEEDVRADAERLQKAYPELGDFVINPSGGPNCWRVRFPKSELEWDKAIRIAEKSDCDKRWLAFCCKYKMFAVKTVVSKSSQPKPEIVNPPVKKIESPIILVVTPDNVLGVRSLIRLCESIKDPEWVWKPYTPIFDLKTKVEIGCRDKSQAMRRLKWLSDRIDGRFEVKG